MARAGWCADYFDPFDYVNVNLDGRSIQDQNNVNFAYVNIPALNKAMDAAANLTGAARAKPTRSSTTRSCRSTRRGFRTRSSMACSSCRRGCTTSRVLAYFGEPIFSALGRLATDERKFGSRGAARRPFNRNQANFQQAQAEQNGKQVEHGNLPESGASSGHFLFLAATVITYVIFFMIPGDPAQLACGRACTQQDVERVRALPGIGHADLPAVRPVLLEPRRPPVTSAARSQPPERQLPDRPGRAGDRRPRLRRPISGSRCRSDPACSRRAAALLLDRASMVFLLVGISAHPVWIGLLLSFSPATSWGGRPSPATAASSGPHQDRTSADRRSGPTT